MGSGNFSLKMCSKSGKLSAEIGIQSENLNLKMLPVRTGYVDGQIGSSIPQLLQMNIFSVDESGKYVVNLEGKSGKTISIGCRFPTQIS